MSERISDKSENQALKDRIEIYKTLVEVFRGYLDTTLTANIWFYAFTGAIVTFYLNDKTLNSPFLRFSLLLPIFISFLSIYLCYRGIRRAEELECKMLGKEYAHGEETALELLRRMKGNYDVEHEPPTNFLISALNATILLVSLVSTGVALLFIRSLF